MFSSGRGDSTIFQWEILRRETHSYFYGVRVSVCVVVVVVVVCVGGAGGN